MSASALPAAVGVPHRSFDDFNAAWSRTQAFLTAFATKHNLTLRKVQHSAALSCDTEAFTAALCVPHGRRALVIAHAENNGWGGPTMVDPDRNDEARKRFSEVQALLFAAVDADETVMRSNMDDLVDRILYTQVIEPKQLKSVIGRTKIAWATNVKGEYTTVKWPALHKRWKTDPKGAREAFVAQGVKSGWFTATTVPVFVNDVVLGVTA